MVNLCGRIALVKKKNPRNTDTLPLSRGKQDAKQFYDRASGWYGHIAEPFERKSAEMALEHLAIQTGEIVLEIGFGTGYCLQRIAQLVGQEGKACGIDISEGMLQVTKRRLAKAGLIDRVELCCGDATRLPYDDGIFDAVFMSFTLELFDDFEIPRVLQEIERVLKPSGRLGVVSMSRSYGESMALRLYKWAHKKWPKYIDCRPIYVEDSLRDAGYNIRGTEKARLIGLLPLEIVIAVRACVRY